MGEATGQDNGEAVRTVLRSTSLVLGALGLGDALEAAREKIAELCAVYGPGT